MKITQHEWAVIYRALDFYISDLTQKGRKDMFPELRHAKELREAIHHHVAAS